MNSLCMYVQDACGDKYLFTCARKSKDEAARFRKHANWWMRTGYKHSPVDKQPAFPCKIVIEEYQDQTAECYDPNCSDLNCNAANAFREFVKNELS